MSFYSGTKDDIQRVVTQLKIGTGRLADMSEEDLADFQAEVDSYINARLSPVYYTPLVQITRSGSTAYPSPIPMIARRFTVAEILDTVYSNESPNLSENARIQRDKAEAMLTMVVGADPLSAPEIVLEGQKFKSRHPFVDRRLSPQTPTGGGGFPT